MLAEKIPNLNLLIIGDGDEYYKRMINDYTHKIPITFTGYKEGVEKYNYLSQAKVLVLPTLKDAWGWVVNEAMYMGIPVITTDKAMAHEMIIDGENGYIIKSKDVGSLSMAVEKILSMTEDKYLDFCKEAHETALKYDVDAAVNCFRAAIDSLS